MYISTRDNYHKVTSAEAIALGMVPEGGLFFPEVLPKSVPTKSKVCWAKTIKA